MNVPNFKLPVVFLRTAGVSPEDSLQPALGGIYLQGKRYGTRKGDIGVTFMLQI